MGREGEQTVRVAVWCEGTKSTALARPSGSRAMSANCAGPGTAVEVDVVTALEGT